MLPSDLEVGDWICIGGLGAYSASVTTKFNQMRALSKVCIMNIPIEQENLNSSQFWDISKKRNEKYLNIYNHKFDI